MSGGEEMDSRLSEELEFLTACLIGRGVNIQVKSQLLHGILEAASFDKDYGVVLNIRGAADICGLVKIFLKDIVYISAQNISLEIDKDTMLKIVTFFSEISHIEDANAAGPSNFADQALQNSHLEESTGLPIRPSMLPTREGEERIPAVALMPELTHAASFIPYIVLYERDRPYAVLQEPGPEGTRYYQLRPGEEEPQFYRLPLHSVVGQPVQVIVPLNAYPVVYPNYPQGQPEHHHSAIGYHALTGPPYSHHFYGRGHQGSG